MAEDKKEFERRLRAFKDAFNKAFDANKFDKAIELGEPLRTEFPDSFDADEVDAECLARAYYHRGNSYVKLGQYERAIADYNQAIEIDSEDAEAYNNRGNSYNGLNQYEHAIEDLNKAIELKPNLVEAYNNRGNSYHGLKLYELAIKDFNKAIEIDSEDASAYFNRGNSYTDLEQYESAIEDFDKAIEINPENAHAYHNRAIAIGQKTTQANLESYGKQLSSITNPAEIDKRFQSRRKASERRLRSFRKYTGGLFILLIFAAPILWFYISSEIGNSGKECTDAF